MGKMSRDKGKAGEREVAELLRSMGIQARRGAQYSGNNESPDVVSSLEGMHIEVKRTERLDLYGALEQAKEDLGGGLKMPVVIHRRNRKPWVCIFYAEDILPLLSSLRPDAVSEILKSD
jgi:hypothetical protein